jgi:hypothetical protein
MEKIMKQEGMLGREIQHSCSNTDEHMDVNESNAEMAVRCR